MDFASFWHRNSLQKFHTYPWQIIKFIDIAAFQKMWNNFVPQKGKESCSACASFKLLSLNFALWADVGLKRIGLLNGIFCSVLAS